MILYCRVQYLRALEINRWTAQGIMRSVIGKVQSQSHAKRLKYISRTVRRSSTTYSVHMAMFQPCILESSPVVCTITVPRRPLVPPVCHRGVLYLAGSQGSNGGLPEPKKFEPGTHISAVRGGGVRAYVLLHATNG